jgi:hypothetical protein
VCLLVRSVVKLLAGRGGEEELAQAGADSSASSISSYLFWFRLVVTGHRTGFSLACRGGEEGEATDPPLSAYRSQALPKWCYLWLLQLCFTSVGVDRRCYSWLVLGSLRALLLPLQLDDAAACQIPCGSPLISARGSQLTPPQVACSPAMASTPERRDLLTAVEKTKDLIAFPFLVLGSFL